MTLPAPAIAPSTTAARPAALVAWSLPILATALAGTLLVLSIIDHAVWRPLPYPDADRLATIFVERDGRRASIPADLYRGLEAAAGEQALLAATRMDSLVLRRADGARRVIGAHVTPHWFELHGMPAHHGRYFAAGDYVEAGLTPVVLSHRGWTSLFDGDPGVVGSDVVFDGTGYRVVGIAPPGLDLQFRADVALPYRPAPDDDDSLYPVARLAPATPVEAFDAMAKAAQARMAAERPAFGRIGTLGARATVELLAEPVQPVATALLLAMVAVLLAATASFVNQVVLAALRRTRRLATELAIGATPLRLARRAAREAALAVLAATALAILLALALVEVLPRAGATWIPRLDQLEVSAPALLATLAAALCMAATGGAVAALVVARQCRGFSGVLTTRGASAGRSAATPRRIALLAQVALSACLVLGCVQVVQSLQQRLQVDLGFDPGVRWTSSLAFPPTVLPTGIAAFEPGQRQRFGAFLDAAERKIGEIPGIDAAGFAFSIPVVDRSQAAVEVEVVGEQGREGGDARRSALLQFASAGYFEAMDLRLVAGQSFRALATEDRAVALVNAAMARAWFGDRDPVGARLTFDGRTVEVIGVVSDIRQRGVHAPPAAEVYVPANAWPSVIELGLVVKGRGDIRGIGPTVRAALASLDPDVPLYFEQTMSAALDRQVADHRFLMLSIWLFGVTATLSAIGGLLMASLQTIAQEHEALSVRAALGATGSRLARDLALRYGALLLPGVACGLALQSTLAARGLERLVPQATSDGLVPIVLATAGLVALFALALLPAAIRAYRINPSDSLRA